MRQTLTGFADRFFIWIVVTVGCVEVLGGAAAASLEGRTDVATSWGVTAVALVIGTLLLENAKAWRASS